MALALCAIAVAFYAGRGSWRWAAAGMLAGAAISVKLLALPVVAPLAVLLIARRSWRAAGAAFAGALAVWAALLIAYAGALGELWRSVVSDHRDARGLGPDFWDNVERVFLHPLDRRTAAAFLVALRPAGGDRAAPRPGAARPGDVDGDLRRVPARPATAARSPLRAARCHARSARGRRPRRVRRLHATDAEGRRRRLCRHHPGARRRPGARPPRRTRTEILPASPGQPSSYVSERSPTSSSARICPSSPISPIAGCPGSSSTRRSFASAPDR